MTAVIAQEPQTAQWLLQQALPRLEVELPTAILWNVMLRDFVVFAKSFAVYTIYYILDLYLHYMHRLCKQTWPKRACYVRGCDVFIILWRHHSDFMRKPWRCSCFSKIALYWSLFASIHRGGIMVTLGLTDNECRRIHMQTYWNKWRVSWAWQLPAGLAFVCLADARADIAAAMATCNRGVFTCLFSFIFTTVAMRSLWQLCWLIDVLSKQRSFLTRLGSPFPRKLLDIWWESL